MTKDELMKYTFAALAILAALSFISWGAESIILTLISILVAVGADYLVSKIIRKTPNAMSASVLGLVIALSYSLGIPTILYRELLPLTAPMAYIYAALISLVGMVLFKKLQGLSGRKYVNPAAVAKLLVFLPFLYEVFLPTELSQVLPPLTSAIGFSGSLSFGSFLHACFANTPLIGSNMQDVLYTLVVLKYHGWTGGASSIAVVVGGA